MTPIQAGERFGPWEIVSIAGIGTSAVVYRARYASDFERDDMPTLAALKVFPPLTSERRADVLNEYRHARTFGDCPYIARIYPPTEVGEQVGLVYELGDHSLRDRLAKGPLPSEDLRQLVHDITEALAALHERNTIHSDVKPANIVWSDGRWKLTDLGAATHFGHDADDGTVAALRAYNRPYMSPEMGAQLANYRPGQPLTTRRSDDMWALGITLYEAALGQHPYTQTKVRSIANLLDVTIPARLYQTDVGLSVGEIIETCLDPIADRRWRSATMLRGIALPTNPSNASSQARPADPASSTRAGSSARPSVVPSPAVPSVVPLVGPSPAVPPVVPSVVLPVVPSVGLSPRAARVRPRGGLNRRRKTVAVAMLGLISFAGAARAIGQSGRSNTATFAAPTVLGAAVASTSPATTASTTAATTSAVVPTTSSTVAPTSTTADIAGTTTTRTGPSTTVTPTATTAAAPARPSTTGQTTTATTEPPPATTTPLATASVPSTTSPLATASVPSTTSPPATVPSTTSPPVTEPPAPPVQRAPTELSPIGVVGSAVPTFRWTAVPGATGYLIWVNQTGNPFIAGKVDLAMTPAEAGCESGTGTCSRGPGVSFPSGGVWWVTAWTSDGTKLLSEGAEFTTT